MTSPEAASKDEVPSELAAVMAAIDARVPFGPGFFLTHLRAFVRDRCPDSSEALPIVELTLESGEIVDVCHVIGVSPLFIALAARDVRRHGEPAMPMRTELVPYATIRRVTIRPEGPGGAEIGFDREHHPSMLGGLALAESPEATLSRAAGITPPR